MDQSHDFDEDSGEQLGRTVAPRRLVPAIALTVALGVLTADGLYPERHLWFGDLVLQVRGQRAMDPRVVLLDTDDWPQPRGALASALDHVAEQKPAAIGFDVILDSPREPQAQDAALAAAIARAGCVVLPTSLEKSPRGQKPAPLLDLFAKAAKSIGFANFKIDVDGVVRRVPIVYEEAPSAEGALAGRYLSFGGAIVELGFTRLRLPAPPVREGEVIVDWAETGSDRLSIASLTRLNSDAPYRKGLETIGFFRDKFVLIGYLGGRNVGDSFLTPFSRHPMDRTPGAVVHANVLDNLAGQRRLHEAPYSYSVLLAILASLAGTLVGRWRASWFLWIATILGAGGLLALEAGQLLHNSVQLNLVPAALAMLLAWLLSSMLSARAVLQLPLVRQVAALFGIQPKMEIAVLNIVSDMAPGGGILRYTFQLRLGEGAGAAVSASRTQTLHDSFQQLTGRLDAFISSGGESSSPEEELVELGKDIRSEFMSRAIERDLARLQVKHVHVELGGHDLAIPWELADIEGRPLGERFGVSRSVVREGGHGLPPLPPARERGFHALIVANPWPLTGKWVSLPAAEAEASRIAQELEPLTRMGLQIEILVGEEAKLETVTKRLASGEVDLLHYSGHAVYEAESSEGIGFLFPEGVLSPPALEKVLARGVAPPIVFANACGSSQTVARPVAGAQATDHSSFSARLSLPSTFMDAGARMYLGCLWAIETEAAAKFAVAFYRHLIGGSTAGAALSRARVAAANYWMTHAAYVMYGDPRLKLARRKVAR